MVVFLSDCGSSIEELSDEEANEAVRSICLWNNWDVLDVQFGRRTIQLRKGIQGIEISDHISGVVPSYVVSFGSQCISLPYSAFSLFENEINPGVNEEYIIFGTDSKSFSGSNRSDEMVRRLLLTPLGNNFRYEDFSKNIIDGKLCSRVLEFRPPERFGPKVSFVLKENCIPKSYFFHVQNGAWNPFKSRYVESLVNN